MTHYYLKKFAKKAFLLLFLLMSLYSIFHSLSR